MQTWAIVLIVAAGILAGFFIGLIFQKIRKRKEKSKGNRIKHIAFISPKWYNQRKGEIKMKKILATLSIIFCLAFAITGLGGCSGCSSTDETGNGGQTVNTITTLEGVWESEYGKTGEHEKIIIDGSSIKCYINKGLNNKDELEWVGIYIPFDDPVSEGTWIFNEDPLGYPVEQGIPADPGTREFNYSNEKLSCRMDDALGNFRNITFTKVSD